MNIRTIPILALLLFTAACAGTSPSPGSDTRFIPLELWAGTSWDGTEQIHPVPIDSVSGKRRNRTVAGPKLWRHPATGEALLVYERVNRKSNGNKRQLFAFNDDASGLGRVYDSRPGETDRIFEDEVMFPLGPWKRGEQREFRFLQHTPAGPRERVATIKIRRLDYTYKDVPHSLKYDWILRDESGEVLFHENYIYSPGKSMVRFRDRLAQ